MDWNEWMNEATLEIFASLILPDTLFTKQLNENGNSVSEVKGEWFTCILWTLKCDASVLKEKKKEIASMLPVLKLRRYWHLEIKNKCQFS